MEFSMTVQTLDDVKKSKPIWPDVTVENTENISIVQMKAGAVLEGGTQSGNASVMFRMEDPKTGKIIIAEMTSSILKAFTGFLIGWEDNFEEGRKNKIQQN